MLLSLERVLTFLLYIHQTPKSLQTGDPALVASLSADTRWHGPFREGRTGMSVVSFAFEKSIPV